MTRMASENTDWKRAAGVVAALGLFLGGCSSAPELVGFAKPSYLGLTDTAAAATTASSIQPHVTSSKVLSAIVFERVTGLEVDPARLVGP